MLNFHETRWLVRCVSRAAMVLGVMAVSHVAIAAVNSGMAPPPAVPSTSLKAPVSGETSANLQVAFESEVNAKERYLAFAKQALREGYPYVAQLFRACARAEEAHAAQHVRAIAGEGREARALLQKLTLGSTIENLSTAIGIENDEVTQLYPARLALARADGEPDAVRSMNFALASERDHVRLLTAALGSLEQRQPLRSLHVCPGCGHTVDDMNFAKCETCFGSAKRFVAVD